MMHSIRPSALLATLALVGIVATMAVPSAAQQAPKEESAPAQSSEDASAAAASETADDSPFDYEASEQISEDSAVSFPIDI